MLGHRLEICFSVNLHSHGLTVPFQITLSKSSRFFRHILANSNLFCLFVSDIMGPYLVLTTAHCNKTRRYLCMKAALMSTPNVRATSLCSSTKVFSLSSSSRCSRYSEFLLVIFEGRPSRKLSCRPRSCSQQNIQRRTVP